jgi:RNA polymerase-binding transcription factor DksA
VTLWADEAADEAEEKSIESVAGRDLDEIEASLAAIEHALDSFDDGTYGRCEICAESIELDRLARCASERRCSDHSAP